MNRTVIVARMDIASRDAVADIFRTSDRTSLPHEIGVLERTLYSLDDIYIHFVDFDRSADEAMRIARGLSGFGQISEQLRPYIQPYNPQTWRSPADAMAERFYHWRAGADRPVDR